MTQLQTPATGTRRGAGYIVTNLIAWAGALVRAPRPPAAAPFLPRYGRLLVAAGIAIVLSMIVLDQPAFHAVARVPVWVNRAFNEFTDFGRSGKFLIPLGCLILLMAIIDAPWVARGARLVMAAVVVRLGFLFVAIALPGLVGSLLKNVIGRRRPSELGPFFYEPFAWIPKFASFPSGHATTAFGVLVAFGVLFPRLRPLLWLYAVLIALSRVVISAHYVSDVLAGALLGGLGALLVRDWFAARRLAFYVGPDRQVRPLPGPSFARLKRVAWGLFGS